MIKKIYIVLLLFFVIYYPPILSFNISILVGGISIFGIIKILFKNKKVIFSKYSIKMLFFIIAISVYLTVVALINNQSVINVNKNMLFWFFSVIPTGIYISLIINKMNIKNKSQYILDLFIVCALIQSILALLAYFYPSFQEWTIEQMIEYGFSESRFTALSTFRWYGLSGKLGYTSPILQMFIAIVTLYLGILKNKKYVICFPFLFFSAIINARTVIVIFLLGIIILIINLMKKVSKDIINRTIMFLSLFFILFITVFYFVSTSKSDNFIWIQEGVNELIKIFTLQDITEIYYFNPQNYILPNGLSIMIGVGTYTGGNLGYATDIGYVNDIYLGGVIYLCMILFFFYYVLRSFYRGHNVTYKFIYQFGLIVLLISNIKGYVFSYNELTSFFIILGIMYNSVNVCNKYRDKE